MKILYLWDADYPWDVRVEKICKSLHANGHDVHIAARNLKKQQQREVNDGLVIHRLPVWKSDRLNYIFSFPLFFSPVWMRFLRKIVTEEGIDLVMVRDLPLAISGIWIAKQFNIPSVLDMAEDYVALVKSIWDNRKFQSLNLIVRNPYFAKLVERYSLPKFDRIMIVVDEAKNVVLDAGVEEQNIVLVGNTPNIEKTRQRSDSNSDHDENINRITEAYSLIYTGGVTLGRGIQEVVKIIPDIVERIPDFLLVVVGAGYAVERLKKMAAELGVEKRIIWSGWVDHNELYKYINAANIGIIPHYRSTHVDTTIPNKIFDYMACGLPVIASDSPPMKRVVEESNVGRAYQCKDGDSLRQAIIEIFESKEDYGANGIKAVEEIYNWNVDESRLLTMIESIN
ncbi:MAG: glycosyltransferase family 4 protein [Candidatus Thiodiazotropha lotti]|uniref:Glycosyltransferase family 4 protein n=1 Tax=Candidatus Thiodiazotropha lotti TaxID=2792787 RepID=A0A9E4K2H2_9GAMM|nr:glycosyltransferase family 4 protein [Candidatus Thiodiazotropha lotti]MCG7928519.1 glycosyltransferase family 4 protein [Candidatus Thiodiazotropha lotti]MCG7938230.1 glycosyltransferase family 4 protein [Candidatus Thiodiazotropha lotti]MCG8002496.1 glycosyltransferase family 4 protein [Candidatus Thiodiazotropha lotti]MCG8008345.1 glycosyltransferase family 4 protein [Candidatus Thiodiazotropha lotti]